MSKHTHRTGEGRVNSACSKACEESAMTPKEFGEAYQQGLSRTVAFLLSRGVPNRAVADVAQSAWLRGWEHIAQLREDTMIIPWINTIALNQYRRILRRHGREEEWKPEYNEISANATSLNWAAIDITKILKACRSSDQSLLEAQLMGTTARELAEREGVTPTAIRIRLLRARRSARLICEPSAALPQAA
jgi:RNA polymerase sigma factor (sigma-70 family)